MRAGNVIGGGDWQKDRIIPDCIRALENGRPIEIRSPNAVRPWQHVLEPLSGYLSLASKMYEEPQKYCGAWNFGPNHDSVITVGEMVDIVVAKWGDGNWVNKPDENKLHEAKLLNLDVSKVRLYLKWVPTWSAEVAIEKTIEWYKEYSRGDTYKICVDQINEYKKLSTKGKTTRSLLKKHILETGLSEKFVGAVRL